MNGVAKGLLPAPDTGEPLVVRLARLVSELACEPVLVGDARRYRAALPGLRVIDDAPSGIGPLGGLSGLLGASHGQYAVALACDLPRLSAPLIARLLASENRADVLAPRAQHGLWEPLCARYRVATVQPRLAASIAGGTRSFQRLFGGLSVEELALAEAERAELGDWDTPEDVVR